MLMSVQDFLKFPLTPATAHARYLSHTLANGNGILFMYVLSSSFSESLSFTFTFSSMAFLSSFSTCWLMLDFISNHSREDKIWESKHFA